MNRRELLGTFAAVAAASLASTGARASTPMAEHEHPASTPSQAAAKDAYQSLREAASGCVSAGQVCLAHCIRLLSEGDKSMDQCARAVNQMLALCGAIQNLAAQSSALTPALAKVALEGCRQCADACEPHVDHHAECKACHQACLDCMKQCEALA